MNLDTINFNELCLETTHKVPIKTNTIVWSAYDGSLSATEYTLLATGVKGPERNALGNHGATILRAEWQSDAADVAQAIYFMNVYVYPNYRDPKSVAPMLWFPPLPPNAFHDADPAIRHTMTCLALGYRICALLAADSVNPSGLDDLRHVRTKVLYHRNLAIQALSSSIKDERKRSRDSTLHSILMFLVVEIRQCASDWRHHFDGMTQLINLRGGIQSFVTSQASLKSQRHLVHYCLFAAFGNTTCIASDMARADFSPDQIDAIKEIYGNGLLSTCPCPPKLFLALVRINVLRSQATRSTVPMEGLQIQALEMVSYIEMTTEADWAAENRASGEGLSLLASIYQSAIMVYCIAALQSVHVLGHSALLLATKEKHHKRLMGLLEHCLKSASLRGGMMKCTLWPLIIAGTGLRAGTGDDRLFLERQLTETSASLGSQLPLLGKTVLRSVWSSPHPHWDDWFDKPYLFLG
ncbi:uncharacterized protein JN550_009611 [Neoarthrinium moseri]|uniref:uncharacterized protein n=1 Tax=Neoarthrinium moseri TaxID=1658444 RepID=UPI001FDBCDF0|nr:uncharacterized protein JN550_009611 [Neoarthrinium moseri]KAI1863291.1 hypothetical protein JN550_009611 [Neoarthrinium moseri]